MTPRPARIKVQQTGELLLQTQSMAIGSSQRKRVSISVRNVSRWGVSIRLPDEDAESFLKNTQVTLQLRISGRRVAIPGRIIWVQQNETNESFSAGVRLHLEITDSLTRETFARWLVRSASN